MNLAISEAVIETEWTPAIENELKNFYNEKIISSAPDPAKMAEEINRVSQLDVTAIELEKRGARTTSWSISNKPDPVFVRVDYKVTGGSPDGASSRRLKLILRGTNQISRIERLQ